MSQKLVIFSSWMFEVWVDKTKLLGNLSLTQAIASFLHLAFVFDLQFPKVTKNPNLGYKSPHPPPNVSIFLLLIIVGVSDPGRHLAKEVRKILRPHR